MDREAKLACNVLSTLVAVAAISFNVFGILVLRLSKIGRSNQVSVIISLSVADILNSLGFIAQISVEYAGHATLESSTGLVVWMVRAVLYHPWYTMYYLLTVDRYLACNFPFKYRSISGKNTMRNILIAIWIVTLIPAPIYCFLDMAKIRVFYDVYVWTVLDSIFTLVFVVAYGTIYYRKKRSNLQFRHKDTNDDNQRFFVVTTVILIGFVFFAIIPDFAMSLLHRFAEEKSIVAHPGFELWWNVNMLIDPLIYVFLQKKFRKTAVTLLRRAFQQLRLGSRSYGTETANATCSSSEANRQIGINAI